ncbi:hypothetical protein D3C72_2529720 [compost metagenome]
MLRMAALRAGFGVALLFSASHMAAAGGVQARAPAGGGSGPGQAGAKAAGGA